MVRQMTPYKKGSKFYIKMYGIEYELILPQEENGKKESTAKKEKLAKKVAK